MLTLATVQSDITSDIRANGLHIRAALRRAAAAGARLVHFPESALSGYPDFQVADWGAVDWPALTAELKTIAELARSLRIWVVLGSNHRLRAPRWPQNCLFVISDELAGVEEACQSADAVAG